MMSSKSLTTIPVLRFVARTPALRRPFTISSSSHNRTFPPCSSQPPRALAKPSPSTLLRSASLATTSSVEAPAHPPQTLASQEENKIFAAVATGGVPYPGIPTFDDPYEKRQWQLEHLAGAFRVFARKGYTEGAAGHISVRDTVDPETFWINPLGVHFGMLTAADMVQIDEHGQVIGGNRAAVNAAGFTIHSAIHKARPDVHAACHAHSKHGKAWSALGRPLDLLNQDACMFWNNHSVYATFGGAALEANEGERIAAALGPTNRCIILQNHGLLTAGGTVDEAAYLFSLMERSCEIQLMVEATGLEKHVIPEQEAKYTYEYNAEPETLYTEYQPDFLYEVWKSNGQIRG